MIDINKAQGMITLDVNGIIYPITKGNTLATMLLYSYTLAKFKLKYLTPPNKITANTVPQVIIVRTF